jgi:Protein of unknown function (DUF3078)
MRRRLADASFSELFYLTIFIMKRLFLSFSMLLCAVALFSQAAADADMLGWKKGGGMGFDLSGLGIKNPRVGGGLNRFGIGGLGTFFANKKANKTFWDNAIGLTLGVQRIGKGDANPFQKSIDQLRLQSKAGYAITADKKWFASGLLVATTSLLKTYEGNFLNDGTTANPRGLFSQFLSPAQLQFHPGVEWKPNDNFSMLISPVGMNMIYVGFDGLAAQNIHGNELGKNTRMQLVPCINANYKRKVFNDRITYATGFNWTTDYLNNPFKQGALNFWTHNLSYAITKNLSLDLFGEAQNDHNKFIQVDTNSDGKYEVGKVLPILKDGDIPATDGADRLGRGTQILGSFMLKYNKVF